MSIEEVKEVKKDPIQESLMDLKKEVEEPKPWQVTYLIESTDKKYDIYSYKLAQWWTKWWIKNKYVSQIWPWVEWTQFTDAWWREISKDKFDAWEVVYLRVPKNKDNKEQNERKKVPWKVEYIGNKKDKMNRNWKWYSYTFSQWGTIWWVMDKFESQLWLRADYDKFCSKNGQKLNKEYFDKWETIYYREANTDIIDSTPIMTLDEIMKLSDNDLRQILKHQSGEANKASCFWRNDKKGWYMVINGKKLYKFDPNFSKENTSYIDVEAHESATNVYGIAIAKKTWNKYRWVYIDYAGSVYRWDLINNFFLCPNTSEYRK